MDRLNDALDEHHSQHKYSRYSFDHYGCVLDRGPDLQRCGPHEEKTTEASPGGYEDTRKEVSKI